MEKMRCQWVDLTDKKMVAYHDEDYGVKKSGLAAYFEVLTLEAFQAGLSWRTILHKRENFRKAFLGFDPKRIAQMTDSDVDRLLLDAGIIRHRKKIEATIKNAKAALRIDAEQGFEAFINQFNDSAELAKALKKQGFSFVGETTCTEILTALGLKQAHEPICFRYDPNIK